MKVIAIVAVDKNLAIGNENQLLFKSKQDMKFLKKLLQDILWSWVEKHLSQ